VPHFDITSFKTWLDVISSLLTIIGGLLAALWAYSKYIVERGLIPPTQFSVDFAVLGRQQEKILAEVIVTLKNCGTSTLIATNIRVDVRTIEVSQGLELFHDSKRPTFGRLIFPGSLRN